MRQRRDRARRAVNAAAWLECPEHERLFLVVFEEARSIKAVVLRPIRYRSADSGARHDSVARVLPSHRERREVPTRCSWNTGVGIRPLVATCARERRNTASSWSPHNVEVMTMTIVALLWITRGRVAIDAAGMREHRIHLLPGDEAFGARRRAGYKSPLDRDEDGQGCANREALSTHRSTVPPAVRVAIVKTCSIDWR